MQRYKKYGVGGRDCELIDDFINFEKNNGIKHLVIIAYENVMLIQIVLIIVIIKRKVTIFILNSFLVI